MADAPSTSGRGKKKSAAGPASQPSGQSLPVLNGQSLPVPNVRSERVTRLHALPLACVQAVHRVQSVPVPSGQCVAGRSRQYVPGSNRQYVPGRSRQYVVGPSRQCVAEPNGQCVAEPNGQCVAGPSGESEAAPSGESEVAPSGESEAAPSGESEAAPSGESEAAPSGESEAAPSGESEAAPSGESEAAPSGESEAGHSVTGQSVAGRGKKRQRKQKRVVVVPNHKKGKPRQKKGGKKPYRPSYILDGILCMVCGDQATGFHYRVMTCEGCKGFFRRIIQKYGEKTPNLKCNHGGKCVINVDTRNSCQSCRYDKCIKTKMDSFYVLDDDGRKEKKEKILRNKLARKEKQYLSQIGSHYRCQHFLDSFWYPMDLSNDGQITLSSRPDVPLQDTPMMRAYIFVLNIPGISEIHKHDLFILVKYRLIDVLALQLSEIFNLKERFLHFCNVRINESDALQNEALKNIFNYAKYFAQYCTLDGIVLGLLCAITFLNSDGPGLIEPQKVQKVQDHIILIFSKHIAEREKKQEYHKGTLAKLLGALCNFENIRDDENKLIWRITGMKEEDSFIRLLMLNGNPDDHMESDESEEENTSSESENPSNESENPSNESVASILLSNSTSPKTSISPSANMSCTSISPDTIISPSTIISPNASTTTQCTMLPASASTPQLTFATPSTSVVSSTCNTSSSTDMPNEANEDRYEFCPMKQEAATERDQQQQNVGYFQNIPHLPLTLTPTQHLEYQQRSGIILQERPSSPPNFSGRGGYYMPNTYGVYVSPLSSASSSSSGHSENIWSRTSNPSLNAVSETTYHARCGLDLSLRGVNPECHRSDAQAADPYRIPMEYRTSNPLDNIKELLSPLAMGVLKKRQEPPPHFQVNVIATAEYEKINSLEKSVEDLNKQVLYLRAELEKKNGGHVVNQEGGMQRSDPSDGNFESPMHGFTSRRPSLSELASSSHFSLLDHPEVTHALSTRQLSYVNKIPSHMRYQHSHIEPQTNSSSHQSGHSFIPSADMPESINQPQCTTFQSYRPLNDQTTIQPHFQVVGYEKPLGYAPFKPGTSSSLQGDQYNHTCNNYYTHAPYGPALIQASRPGASTSYQDHQYNPASTYSYPCAPYESLTLQPAFTTAGESNPAMEATSQARKGKKRSSEPETCASLPLKKQQRNMGIKKKWLQAHLTEAE